MVQMQAKLINIKQAKLCGELHKEALRISRELHNQEFLLVEALQRIQENKVYRFIGYKSLYQYAMSALGLSPDRAYNIITVARKAHEVKRLQEALKEKTITLSKAKRLCPVISNENADEWIKKATELSQRLLESAVARVAPKSQIQEGTRFVSENILELKAAISQETEAMLKRAQDLICQSEGKAASLDTTLKCALQVFLEKKDPVLKAQRAVKRSLRKGAKAELKIKKETKTEFGVLTDCESANVATENSSLDVKDKQLRGSGLASFGSEFQRLRFKQNLKHKVILRDQNQCQAMNQDGSLCRDSRWVDIHHCIPVSKGGQNTLENLIILCRRHHQMEHA